MSDLQKYLDQLIGNFPAWSKSQLTWSRVLIVEDASVEHGKISRIPRSALASPQNYAERFNSHLQMGYDWINMNAAGILDDTLLVVIELPHSNSDLLVGRTSVNFSGPNGFRWDATGHIEIVEPK